MEWRVIIRWQEPDCRTPEFDVRARESVLGNGAKPLRSPGGGWRRVASAGDKNRRPPCIGEDVPIDPAVRVIPRKLARPR